MNKYCVYLHRRKDNNEVFYIGEGTERRPYTFCKYTRSKSWHDIVSKSGGHIVEIVKTNLTKEEALDFEKQLINQYPNVINSKTRRTVKSIPSCVLDEFEYSETSPSFLIWKDTKKPAGFLIKTNNKNYWRVTVGKQKFMVHRLIATLIHGNISLQMVVNHLDGNGLNNHRNNLEVCSQAINMKNVNTKNSEHQGVKFKTRDNAWVATWRENGKTRSKSFSVKKYGLLESKELALQFRFLMIQNHAT